MVSRQMPEVVHRADEPLTEQVVPNAIDEDASGQGIVRIGDRLGHLEPAAGRRADGPAAFFQESNITRGTASAKSV